ncbi:MAG: NAD(P)-dependent oxidoreductase [bacterium]|nr:NAD(P)-dependent oxidoreductase [bacterium]
MPQLVVSIYSSDDAHLLEPIPDGVEVVEWDLSSPPPRDHIDMVVFPPFARPPLMEAAGNVSSRLLQLQSIGYDSLEPHVPSGSVVANGASVHESATAELALALLLAVTREVPRMVRNQDLSRWQQFHTHGLADSRVLMVGYGGVGKAIADRLTPFEVALTRVATSRREDELGVVHAVEELGELLPEADAVIVIVPLTPKTEGLVDDEFLAAMPDGAVLVNVARGKVADTSALLRHADRLRIALDVTDPEPLPADHPLWQKATLIAPHVGGATDAQTPRLKELLQRQMAHLLADEEPENIVLRG